MKINGYNIVVNNNNPIITDEQNNPLTEEAQTKIFKQLTKEINLTWVPDLKILIQSFPKHWTDLLQCPPNFENIKPESLYIYAKDVLKDRWRDAERAILRSGATIALYARDIIKGRWPEGESELCVMQAYIYARDIIKGRWLKAEQAINGTRNAKVAYLYARDIIKGRWPQEEPEIAKHPEIAKKYARDIIKGEWKQLQIT